ncbi:MAG TPA: SprT family zinc-dependent metalloprotease [Elusimicrobiota bacterium]|nr:SprT family zinc-dependent metalloprotease [Elusimicrobiota bacterium]
MPTITYKSHELQYEVRLTARRKTIALQVHRNGLVEVRAPRFIKRTELHRFVGKRAEWILEKQAYFADLAKKFPPREFKNGESFPLLGRSYRLKVERRPGLPRPICKLAGRRLKVLVNGQVGDELRQDIRRALRDWYAKLTQEKTQASVRKHTQALAVAPKTLKVVEQTRRWASCSRAGDIRFNWRLSMMPNPVLEYVVVHELCHLKNHDHSAKFWAMLKSILPDYEKRQRWLRQYGAALTVF